MLLFSHCVWLFATPWTATRQVPLFFTISWSLLRFMSIVLVMLLENQVLYDMTVSFKNSYMLKKIATCLAFKKLNIMRIWKLIYSNIVFSTEVANRFYNLSYDIVFLKCCEINFNFEVLQFFADDQYWKNKIYPESHKNI